ARHAGHIATSIDAFGDSLAPLLLGVGALFAQGVRVRFDQLFRDRHVRPIELETRPSFLASPCGRSGNGSAVPVSQLNSHEMAKSPSGDIRVELALQQDVLTVVRGAIADQTGFPPDSIGDDRRFLDHLHLNSISVTRVVTRAAQALGLRVPDSSAEFVNATARELAAGLAALRDLTPRESCGSERVPGVRPWVRTF